VLSPLLGRKIATNPPAWLPAWYDFRQPQEKGISREEFENKIIEKLERLHARAIRGEFHPDKLDEIDWSLEDISGGTREVNEGPVIAATHEERIRREHELKLAQKHGWDKLDPMPEEDTEDEDEYEEIELEVDMDMDADLNEVLMSEKTAVMPPNSKAVDGVALATATSGAGVATAAVAKASCPESDSHQGVEKKQAVYDPSLATNVEQGGVKVKTISP